MTCRQQVGSDIACLSIWGSGRHADIRHLPTKQIIEGLNAVAFNVSNAGCGDSGRGPGYRGHPGAGRSTRHGYAPQMGTSLYTSATNPPGMARAPPIGLPYFHVPGQFNGDAAAGGIPAYYPPTPGHGGVYAAGGYPGAGHFNGGCSGFQGCHAPMNAQA